MLKYIFDNNNSHDQCFIVDDNECGLFQDYDNIHYCADISSTTTSQIRIEKVNTISWPFVAILLFLL